MAADVVTEQPARKRSSLAYLVLALVLASAVFAATGIATAQLNPYVYDDASIDRIGQDLDSGQNFANYDPNIDLRALRAAEIRHMTATPDIVIFGGSRWQEAHSDMVPGHTMFNAYVSNDQVEDMLAVTYLLDKAGRLPKTMVFSLRFVSLQPLADRDTFDWQNWGPEYSAMAEKLGLTPHSFNEQAPVRTVSGTFNYPGLWDRIQQVTTAKAGPAMTDELQDPTRDIIAADGSLHWSKKSEAKFTKPAVDKLVDAEYVRSVDTHPSVDPSMVDMMGKLIDWLRAKGVRVMIAQTPYHPDYWQRIQGHPFGATMLNLEQVANKLAADHGAVAAGNYDPAGYPDCTADHFLDHIHPRPACLRDVFATLPPLVVTGG
jgi:hypothetical protein